MQKDGATLLYVMDRRAMYNYHQCNSKAYTIHHPSIGINMKKNKDRVDREAVGEGVFIATVSNAG